MLDRLGGATGCTDGSIKILDTVVGSAAFAEIKQAMDGTALGQDASLRGQHRGTCGQNACYRGGLAGAFTRCSTLY